MTLSMTDTMDGSTKAVLEAGKIWSSGMQDIAETMVASTRSQIDENIAAWSALKGVKTFEEAKAIQSQIVRSFFEKAHADFGTMTEAFNALSERTFEPLKTHMAHAAETVAPPHSVA